MDKILHRGEYAIEKPEKIQALKPVNRFRKIIAMGSEFSLTDKLIYLATLAWTSLLVIIFVIGTLYNLLIKKASDQSWLVFWRYYIWALVGMSILTTVWFTIGGLVDIKKMFKLLKSKVIDESDDGWVHKSQKEEIQK